MEKKKKKEDEEEGEDEVVTDKYGLSSFNYSNDWNDEITEEGEEKEEEEEQKDDANKYNLNSFDYSNDWDNGDTLEHAERENVSSVDETGQGDAAASNDFETQIDATENPYNTDRDEEMDTSNSTVMPKWINY